MQTRSPAVPRIRLDAQALLDMAYIAVLFGFIYIGAGLQANVLLNHDVGYVVHAAGWILQGMRFGHEVVEPNPPLIYYLSMPAALLSSAGFLNEAGAMRLVTFAFCLLGLFLADRALLPMRAAGRVLEARFIVVVIAAVLCLWPGRSFAQREHFALAMTLPYILMVGCRLEFAAAPYARSVAITIGFVAALGFALKPYFLAVPVLVELVHLARTRSLKASFRPETWTMLATMAVYGVSIPLLAPDYLSITVPLAQPIYWAFENTTLRSMLGALSTAKIAFLFSIVFLLAAKSIGMRYVAMVVAAIGYAAAFLLQAKGYDYHSVPAVGCLYLLCAIAGADLYTKLRATPARRTLAWISAGFVVFATIFSAGPAARIVQGWYYAWNLDSGVLGLERVELIRVVDQLAPQRTDYVYAFSTHPYPGFPTMNYARGEWASRMHSQWVIPAVVKRGAVKDPGLAQALVEAERAQREIVFEDFSRYRPKVVLVESGTARHAIRGRSFDDIAYFSEDPRFAALWNGYRQVATVGSVKVFVRD